MLKASITAQNAIQVPNDPMYKARKLLRMQTHGFRFNLNGLGKADRGMHVGVLFEGVQGSFHLVLKEACSTYQTVLGGDARYGLCIVFCDVSVRQGVLCWG